MHWARAGAVSTTGSSPVVETTGRGKVRGCDRSGVFTFKGIPYGAPTGGAARSSAAGRLPWSGIRSSALRTARFVRRRLVCAAAATISRMGTKTRFCFTGAANHTASAEDLPAAERGPPGLAWTSKRPVMVWLHGGRVHRGVGA